MHHDANGWPCVGKYVGLIIDDDEPIFYSEEQQAYLNKTVEYYLLKNSYGSI